MNPSSADSVTLTIEITLSRQDGHWRVSATLNEPYMDDWPEDLVEFGTAVRRGRLAEGVSQLEFAGLVGITPTGLRNIETGRFRPSPYRRNSIVRVLRQLGIAPPDPRKQEESKSDVPK